MFSKERSLKAIKEDIDYYRKKQEGPLLPNQSYQAYIRAVEQEYKSALIRNISVSRLENICQAERDGQCLVLPCKIGSKVWLLGEQDVCREITEITLDSNGFISFEVDYYNVFRTSDIGKTMFLDPETIPNRCV